MADTITVRTSSDRDVVEVVTQGPQGPAGEGVPTGGTTGQVLRKVSGTDYDTEWAAAGSGGGTVTSVSVSGSDGIEVDSGSPITTSGTIALGINAATLRSHINVADGAEVNVNADWNAASGDAQILNKPTLGTAAGVDADQNLTIESSVEFTSITASDGNNQVILDGLGIGFSGTAAASTRANLGLGTAATAASTDFAAASHTHGNITNDGKIGSTAGLPVVTTTAGAVTTLALGTAGQVLKVNSGANGVEFAAASGGGGEVRFDTSSSYTYTGLAAAGTSESTASWLIRRSEFDGAGSHVATLTANNVEWDDRLTASYS